jgi:hypothetical protein
MAEFAVVDIEDILSSDEPFDCLAIVNEESEVLIALAEVQNSKARYRI